MVSACDNPVIPPSAQCWHLIGILKNDPEIIKSGILVYIIDKFGGLKHQIGIESIPWYNSPMKLGIDLFKSLFIMYNISPNLMHYAICTLTLNIHIFDPILMLYEKVNWQHQPLKFQQSPLITLYIIDPKVTSNLVGLLDFWGNLYTAQVLWVNTGVRLE